MRHSGLTCLGLFFGFLVLATALPAQVAPIGPPFEIAPSEDSHTPPVLAARPDGTYLVLTKAVLPQGLAMYGRLLGPTGALIADPFLIAMGDFSSPAVAVFPDGGFVVVWDRDEELLGSVHDRDGRLRVNPVQVAPRRRNILYEDPSVAAGPDGSWMVVWNENLAGSGDWSVFRRWFAPDGTPGSAPLPLSSRSWFDEGNPRVATRPDGGFLTVWTEVIPAVITGPSSHVSLVRHFDAAGAASSEDLELTVAAALVPRLLPLPGGEGFVLADVGPAAAVLDLWRLDAQGNDLPPRNLAVTVSELPQFNTQRAFVIDPAGRLLLVGTGKDRRLYGQLYDAVLLQPLGLPFELPTAKPASSPPLLASARPGQFLMAWEEKGRWMGEILLAGCAAPHLGLCLAQSRFRVEVSWRDHQGNTGEGHAVPLQDDTGAFWFFSPSNVELLVKVLDGRSLNGHFWVFYGSLSDVEYEIRVTDTQTGDVRRYHNPAGTLASHADVQAFPPAGDPQPATITAVLPGRARQIGDPVIAPFECHSSEVALCLAPLYQVTIDFVDPETGVTRHARAVPFSRESGAFWFFDPDNLEIFVKVLDGTAVNGHVWVFHGALTDVEYTLTVQDQRLTGGEWTYHNPRGRMHSGADTSALSPPGN
jgi:hypothetical protein